MHVIWARGQEADKYNHFPKSGLEKENANVPDFYKPDELKYHGHGDQRGVTAINFFGKKNVPLILSLFYIIFFLPFLFLTNIQYFI